MFPYIFHIKPLTYIYPKRSPEDISFVIFAISSGERFEYIYM